MNETAPTPDQNPPQEVDLFQALSRMFNAIGRGLKKFASWIKSLILKTVSLIVKHIWFLLILLILGGFAGWGKVKLSKPYYESEMTVETKIVSRLQIADRINGLQHYISDKNYAALSRELGLTENDVRDIFFIKCEPVSIRPDKNFRTIKLTTPEGKEEVVTEEITDFEKQLLRIRVRFWNSAAISKMGKALEAYISKDTYISELVTLTKENNLARQTDIQAQIDQLTLFQQKNIEKSSNVMVQGNSPLMVQNEEKTYVNEILDLKNQILNLKREYELTKPINIVQPFITYENPIDNTVKNVFVFALIFFVIGFVILVGREGWKRV